MNPTESLVSALAAGRSECLSNLPLVAIKCQIYHKIKSPTLFRDTKIVSRSTRLSSFGIKDRSGFGRRRAKLWTSGLVDSYVVQKSELLKISSDDISHVSNLLEVNFKIQKNGILQIAHQSC
jgi:hypothetical protein